MYQLKRIKQSHGGNEIANSRSNRDEYHKWISLYLYISINNIYTWELVTCNALPAISYTDLLYLLVLLINIQINWSQCLRKCAESSKPLIWKVIQLCIYYKKTSLENIQIDSWFLLSIHLHSSPMSHAHSKFFLSLWLVLRLPCRRLQINITV